MGGGILGLAFVWEAAARSAAGRLEQTLATLRGQGFRRKFEKLSNVDDWYVKT